MHVASDEHFPSGASKANPSYMTKPIKSILYLLLFFNTALAGAVDLGVHGTVWQIVERDMREVMAEELAKVDVSAINAELVKSAETFFERLPQAGLPRAEETRTRWVDPSIELQSEIKAPFKREDGEWEWRVLHPAGTRVNPLEHVQPPDRMLFFNAESEEETKFVREVLKLHPVDVTPVATGGNIKPLTESLDRPVYFAKDDLLSRFAVKATPSMVGTGKGVLALYLAVTEIKLPAKPDIVRKAWYGLTQEEAAAINRPTRQPAKSPPKSPAGPKGKRLSPASR